METDTNNVTAEQDKNPQQLLQDEIQSYQREQANVTNMLGKLGGVQSRKKDRILNLVILLIAVTVFVLDITFELFDPIYAVEFGILLISVKIIMLIHSLSKMGHFNFWILHSIDIRINDIATKLERLEGQLQAGEQAEKETVH